QMDCLTCHDERTLSPEHREDRAGTAFLRRDPRSLCSSCHRPRLPPDSVVAHGLEIGRAHLGTRQPEPEGKLDRASRGCLACHDGTVARAPRIEIGASSLSGWNGPHPIGVRYARAGSSALRNRAFLPAAIRLPDGRVACSSCHSVYARGENMLVLPRTESRLCLACHSK
ncbi:MAG: cytochrome c3 family protein, partial [Planctomycetota bacterium]